MKLAYQAYNRAGERVSGTVDAGGRAEAADKLYQEGLFVTVVTPVAGGEAGGWLSGKVAGHRSGGLRELTTMTKQLAVLCSTGTPVVQALAAVERQIPPGKWKDTVTDVRKRVEEGEALTDAMARHPRCFDAVYRSLITAGESGGQLNKMLDRLAAMTRQQMKVRNTLIGAMAYPAVLMLVSVVVVIVMLVGVLPRFAGLFDSLDTPVPPTTQMLMAVSGFLQGYWWAMLIALAGGGAGGVVWYRRSGGRERLDRWTVRMPLVGKLTRSLVTARIVRVLGYLLDSRVPMLEALRLTKEAAGNAEYRALIEEGEDAVTHGDTLSSVFRTSPLVSASVYEAVVTGERTGQLAPILLNLADFLDEDNEVAVKSLTSMLEPLILVVLGVVVGFVALSMFMPLFDLTAAAEGGGPA